MNWEKARRDSRESKRDLQNRFKLGQEKYRNRLEKIVQDNNLRCFSCKNNIGPWAKTGRNKYGLWAICTQCVINRN